MSSAVAESQLAGYFTHAAMYSEDGLEIPLQNRGNVLRILQELNTNVLRPLCQKFNLWYDFLFEQHCQANAPGVARRETHTLTMESTDGTSRQKTRLVTIRLRVRLHPSRGDPQTEFISRGTQLGVLLHELCHLKSMDHDIDFMILLREVFQEATKMGVFKPDVMFNEYPSRKEWENEIFHRGGNIPPDELLLLMAQQNRRDKASAPSQCCGGARDQCGNSPRRECSVTPPGSGEVPSMASTPRGTPRTNSSLPWGDVELVD